MRGAHAVEQAIARFERAVFLDQLDRRESGAGDGNDLVVIVTPGGRRCPIGSLFPSHDKPRMEALNAVARMYNIRKLRAIIRAFASEEARHCDPDRRSRPAHIRWSSPRTRRDCPHSLSRLRQAGLSEAVDKVISYRCIAQRLGAEPMAYREMRVGDQEQFCFSPRLVMLAQLRKRSRQEFA